MLTFPDFTAIQARYQILLDEAEKERLIRQALANTQKPAHYGLASSVVSLLASAGLVSRDRKRAPAGV